jgi:chromosome segregation ATPase
MTPEAAIARAAKIAAAAGADSPAPSKRGKKKRAGKKKVAKEVPQAGTDGNIRANMSPDLEEANQNIELLQAQLCGMQETVRAQQETIDELEASLGETKEKCKYFEKVATSVPNTARLIELEAQLKQQTDNSEFYANRAAMLEGYTASLEDEVAKLKESLITLRQYPSLE